MEDTSGGGSDATLSRAVSGPTETSLFSQIHSLLPDAALVAIDRNGVIIESTPAVEALIGSSSSTILHRHLDVFVHPDDRALTAPGHDERSHTGQVAHWKPARVDTRRGWRRVEFLSLLGEDDGFVVEVRAAQAGAPSDVRAAESIMLDLLSAVRRSPDRDETWAALQLVLDRFVDLIGWDRARIRFAGERVVDLTEVSSRPGNSSKVAPLSAINPRLATVLRQRHRSERSRQVWSEDRHRMWLNGIGSWFRTSIGGDECPAWLELAHHQDNVVLTSWQLSVARSVADVLGSTWERWADQPEPETVPRSYDLETRLASWAPLVDELDRRLRSPNGESVCAFRIHLDGLATLRARIGDDAAARVMIAVAHGVGFVLDDCLVGRTGDDELTAIAEIHADETVDDVIEHIRHEIDESFSWRFDVKPRIGAGCGRSGDSATTLLRTAASQVR